MNLGNVLSSRQNRLGLLVVFAFGWIIAALGAFAESGAVLGVGLIIAAATAFVCAKLVLELSVAETHRPATVPVARFDDVVIRLEQAAAEIATMSRTLESTAKRLSAESADLLDATAKRLSAESADSLDAMSAQLRSEQAISDGKLDALERRLTPTRRFAATKPAHAPRELTLSESLGAASILGDTQPR